ncbi:MAG: hemolysin family protein [bacterium]
MVSSDFIRLLVFLLLLGGSAFASSVEASFFSLSPSSVSLFRESGNRRERRVAELLTNPQKLLTTILVFNTIVNILGATITAWIAIDWARRAQFPLGWAMVIQVSVVSALFLYGGELLPKLYGLKYNERWAKTSSWAVSVLQVLLSPIAVPLSKMSHIISRLLQVQRYQPLSLSEKELKALVSVGYKHGALEPEEREMIHSIFELGDTLVREVMIPRVDMVVAPKEVSYSELVGLVRKFGHSRIPIYEGTIDEIVGVVHAKDLLSFMGQEDDFSVDKVMREAYFVPEEKKVDELLREFQAKKVHMAIVVDEYGGTAGLVTLEDVLEEIVGDIQDEYDRESPQAFQIDDNTIVAHGRTTVYDLNEMMGTEVIELSEAYDTVAGFIYGHLGRVPEKGESFLWGDFRFTVDDLSGKRILKVKVERLTTGVSEEK